MAPPNGIAEFWTKVDIRGEDECWPWREDARDQQGYGLFYTYGKRTRAHRWLLGHLRGTPLIAMPRGIEDGCHRCDNPPCCNPAHLYVGTRKRNIADAVERSRLWQLRKDVCAQGHPYDAITADGRRRCYACERERDGRTANRTHCRNGHEFAEGSFTVCANGTRRCRGCESARVDVLRQRAAALTHCKWGHEYTTANTAWTRRGTRRCRACTVRRDAERARR